MPRGGGGRSSGGGRSGGFGGRSGSPSRGFGGRSSSPSRGFGGRSGSPSRGFGGRSSSPSRGFGGRSSSVEKRTPRYSGTQLRGYGRGMYRAGAPLWFGAAGLAWFPLWWSAFYGPGFQYMSYPSGYYALPPEVYSNQETLEQTINYYTNLPENSSKVEQGLVLIPDYDQVPQLRWVEPVNGPEESQEY